MLRYINVDYRYEQRVFEVTEVASGNVFAFVD